MAVLASDNFNRANASTLGANWTTPSGELTLKVASNACVPSDLFSFDNTSCYTGVTWPNDQYSQLKVTTGTAGGGQGFGPSARQSTTASTRYRLIASTAATNNIQLSKEVANTFTVIWDRTSAFTNGNLVRLEAQGSTLRAYNAGVQVGASTTDSSIASGNPGIFYSSVEASASGDDWEGGDFAAGSTFLAPRRPVAPQAVRRASYY